MTSDPINLGLLKLDLMLKGVRFDESFCSKHQVLKDFRLGKHTFGTVDFILPGEICVSAPYQEDFVENSPYKIRFIKNKFYVASKDISMPIKWVSQPRFYEEAVNDKVKISDIASVHGNYVSLAIGGHRYLQSSLVTKEECANSIISVEETVSTLDRIQKERPIDVVSLSCWDPDEEDGGIFQIKPYIEAIKKNFNVLVFIEVHLPKDENIIDQTYAIGADSVCYHIGNLCSHGHSHIEPERNKEFENKLLKHAVSDFPGGSILVHITVGPIGDRSNQQSKEEIESLCANKVLPILTIENLHDAHDMQMKAEQVAELQALVYEKAKENNIKIHWFSKLSPFFTPFEGRHLVGDAPKLKVALMNFYQSRVLGGSISSGLSNLRRKLRVREVSKGNQDDDE